MRLWRRPLDEGQVLIEHGVVHIITERCKGCGFCVEFCPREVLRTSNRHNSKGYFPPEVVQAVRCVRCSLCEVLCPEFAIYVLRDGEMPATIED